MKYPIIVICGNDRYWYLGFEDGYLARLFPTKKKRFFQRWNPANCPIYNGENVENVFYFEDCEENVLSQDEVRQVFEIKYVSVENYLFRLNIGVEIKNMHYRSTLWALRNFHGQCGNCSSQFDHSNPEINEGMCRRCTTHS